MLTPPASATLSFNPKDFEKYGSDGLINLAEKFIEHFNQKIGGRSKDEIK